MDPLTIGMALGGGLISGIGNYYAGKAAKEEAERKEQALRAQMAENNARLDKEKQDLTTKDTSLSQDFLVSYATIKEKDRADGLRGEYGRNKSELASSLARLTSERAQLNTQLAGQIAGTPSDSSILGQSIMQGLGSGASMYASGMFASLFDKKDKDKNKDKSIV